MEKRNGIIKCFSDISVVKILWISISIHVALECLFPSMFGDNFLQIASFYNLMQGHGLSLSYASANNLSEIYYEKLNLWPFGFTFFNYPLWFIFKNIFIATLINNILAIVLFFITIYKILLILNEVLNDNYKKIILLFLAIQIMPSRYMGSTDLWCLSLLFLSIYLTLKILTNASSTFKKNIFYSIVISIAISCTITLRYTYWLFGFIFPCIFFIYGFLKNKKILYLSFITFICTGILSSMYIYFHYKYFGKIMPTSLPIKDTFQWKALLLYNPLFFNVLFRDSISINIISKIFSGQYNKYLVQIIFHFIGLILVIPIIKYIGNYFFIQKTTLKDKLNSPLGIFFIIGFFVIVINNLTIIYSTLQFGVLGFFSNYHLGYSTVAEVRYFAPTLILLYFLLIFTLVYTTSKYYKKIIYIFIVLGFSFAILINGLLIYARCIKSIPPIQKYLHYDDHNLKMYNIIKSYNANDTRFIINQYTDLQDYYFARYAGLPIVNSNINTVNFKTNQYIQILTIIPQNDTTLQIYKPEVLIKNLKPNYNLIKFNLNMKK